MTHYKAFRTKLKLNSRLRTLMAKDAGYSRWVCNWGLALWESAYRSGLKPNIAALKKVNTCITERQNPWMGELSSIVCQHAFIAVGDGYQRFFKGVSSRPRLKKKGVGDSFTIDNSGRPILLGGVRHKLPFTGWVQTCEALPEWATKKVTLTRCGDGWALSFHTPFEPKTTPKQRPVVGADLGVQKLATLSSGVVFPSIRPYRPAS